MNCPKCGHAIPADLLLRERQREIASKKRPGAKGLVRNPKGRPAKSA